MGFLKKWWDERPDREIERELGWMQWQAEKAENNPEYPSPDYAQAWWAKQAERRIEDFRKKHGRYPKGMTGKGR